MTHDISSLIRSAVFVSDLERSTIFYRALGFTSVYFEGELDGPSTAAALKTPLTTTCLCRILRPEGRPNFGMIGLFELTPAQEAIPRGDGPPRLGAVALVLYATPIHACRAHLWPLKPLPGQERRRSKSGRACLVFVRARSQTSIRPSTFSQLHTGIGKSLARKLASQGINVVLVALDDPLLAAAASEIAAEFPGITVRVVGADLGAPGAPYLAPIAAATADLTIQCLFFNAGYMVTGFFEST